AMRDALSIFDRVVSFSGKELTREAVTENLNVLDYETYFNMTSLLLENKIPDVLNAFNTILSKGFEGHHFINGLASHFRDLLVAKDKATVALLEVGDTTKKKYLEQATKANIPFLMQAINKANDCDLSYRASKNQRLLVELTLMQIASITFDGEKKKSANYIIPATFFQSLSPKKQKVNIPNLNNNLKEKVIDEKPKTVKEKPVLKSALRRSSSLSLKSIHHKKEVKKRVVEENFDKHPKTIFTQDQLENSWKEYHKKMIDKGENNMATALGVSTPKLLPNFVIQLNLPSTLIEDHFKEGKYAFLKFLRESLNNYGVRIKIVIDNTIEEKKAYGSSGKYKVLVKKNPLLDKLRQTFELEL
ncbi:MAG: DNA polymerase III subunit gamma/tau, partial [Polaribacter sp.]